MRPALPLADAPQTLRAAIRPMSAEVARLTHTIRGYDREVERLCEKVYPEALALRRVNGVGSLTAVAFVLVLAEPHRFKNSRQIGPCLGSCSPLSQPGESSPQMHIRQAGNGFLRKLPVQAAHYIRGRSPRTPRYPRGAAPHGEWRRPWQEARGRGRGRKLAVMLHCLWKTGEVYDCFPNAPPSVPVATI